jgi:hypothetical protein
MSRTMRGERSGIERGMCGVVGVLVLGVAMLGCNDLTTSGRPGKARFHLDGTASTSMTLLTSQDFFVGADGSLDFASMDSTSVAVPFDRTVQLGEPARFYISASNGEDEALVFTMKVWIGGESWYNETRILSPGDDFEFVYRYNEPGIYGQE